MMHFRGTQIVCQITMFSFFIVKINRQMKAGQTKKYYITKTRSLVQDCFQPFISPLLLYSKKKASREDSIQKIEFSHPLM